MHMQRKRLGKKVLSGLLALGLCVSMVPTVSMTTYAADPTGLSLKLDGADAAAWNGKDEVRVYVDAAESGAALDTASFQITEGGDKYELSADGYLTLKPGKTAAKGDKITIGASAKYYSEDQLLWSDGLEIDGSLKPSQAGMYGLTHTADKAHNGLKSGTTNSVQCKDGMWSADVNSTGRLVFWYYDPATPEEMDNSIITDEFDQIKFGMAINEYSNFLMGVGVPSSTETDDKTQYLKTYTVREAGTWRPTNIQRTPGWHKMEAEVTAEGTKAFIDGNAVCFAGEDTPLLVTGVKTINKAAVATNWANKADVMTWVEGKHFIDDMYILKSNAGEIKTDDSLTMTVTVDSDVTEQSDEMKLTFGADNSGSLTKGETGKVYLDNADNVAIESVEYTTNNENVIVGKDGTLTLKEGYKPAADETVKVTAKVKYYDEAGVVFTDSFEGEKQFTDGDAGLYKHSDKGSLFGRYAASATSTNIGSPAKNLDEVTNVTVTAYYYDANGGADQTKWGFGINNNDDAPLGIFYDGTIAPLVDNMTKTHYGTRIKGYTYNNYGWGTTDVERTADWHKFQWAIDETKGLTMMIDGKVVSTNPKVGKDSTDKNLVKVENNEQITSLNRLAIRDNWNNNATNMSEISDRHFIDGVSVVKNGTAVKEATLESVEIPVIDVQYTVTPDRLTVDKTYPKDQTIYISPYMEGETDIVDVLVNGMPTSKKLWTAGKGKAPQNATQYPAEMKGYKVVLDAAAIKGMTDGETEVVLVTKEGTELKVPVTVDVTEHVATDYYLSNNGDDSNDGHTPETAWKTFDKLQNVTFGPGDHIYLDAESTWNGVQFRPEGSGAEGKPIVLTKYNDGGDSSKRPVLNGNGTIADLEAHSYAAFDTWRAFYPSGTIELFNVEQWEVRGVEVTNYVKEMQKGATGRNGIAVIHDYMEVQDWNDGENAAAGITSNKKASVMMQKTKDGILEIAVSDPTQENNGTIELTVDVPCEAVVSQDETVTVNEVGDTVKLSVNVAGSMGASHTVKLQMVMPVDKEGLETAIESAKSEDQTKYTEETWNALIAVVERAEAMLENADVDQETVDAMEEKVLEAIEALELKPEPVDKSALEKVIKEAETLKEKDYTAESWKAMQDALKAAQVVSEDKDATEENVEAARASLAKALENLVKEEDEKPTPDPKPEQKPDPTLYKKPESRPAGNEAGAVQTGDTANVMLWAVLALAGCTGIVSAILIRRKK